MGESLSTHTHTHWAHAHTLSTHTHPISEISGMNMTTFLWLDFVSSFTILGRSQLMTSLGSLWNRTQIYLKHLCREWTDSRCHPMIKHKLWMSSGNATLHGYHRTQCVIMGSLAMYVIPYPCWKNLDYMTNNCTRNLKSPHGCKQWPTTIVPYQLFLLTESYPLAEPMTWWRHDGNSTDRGNNTKHWKYWIIYRQQEWLLIR